MDDGCIGSVDSECNISDDSDRSGSDCDDCEVVEKYDDENCCHSVHGMKQLTVFVLLFWSGVSEGNVVQTSCRSSIRETRQRSRVFLDYRVEITEGMIVGQRPMCRWRKSLHQCTQ